MKHFTVQEYIRDIFSDYKWYINPYIKKYRKYPDLYLVLGNRVIIVEIDSKQHKPYNKEAEAIRMYNIKKAFSNKGYEVIFIRFNPDEYKDYKGKEHKSYWKKENDILGTEIWEIDDEEDKNNRLNTLVSRIKYWMDLKNKIIETPEGLNYENLYYDGHRPHDAPEDEAIVIDDSESESEDEEESEESGSEDEDDSDDEDEDYNPKYDKRAYKRRKID